MINKGKTPLRFYVDNDGNVVDGRDGGVKEIVVKPGEMIPVKLDLDHESFLIRTGHIGEGYDEAAAQASAPARAAEAQASAE